MMCALVPWCVCVWMPQNNFQESVLHFHGGFCWLVLGPQACSACIYTHISHLSVCCAISLTLSDFAQHCAILKSDECAKMLISSCPFGFDFLPNKIEFLMFNVTSSINVIFPSTSYTYVGWRTKFEMLYVNSKFVSEGG